MITKELLNSVIESAIRKGFDVAVANVRVDIKHTEFRSLEAYADWTFARVELEQAIKEILKRADEGAA